MDQAIDTIGEADDRLLTDQLFEQMSEAIVRGTFAAGTKLSEPRLAAQYGVSRGPLREAIRRLGLRDSGDLLVALGDAGLPMPIPPAQDIEEQAATFVTLWKMG